MYCHSLQLTNAERTYEVPCESLPGNDNLLGIWPYELELHADLYEELLGALREWANTSGFAYRLFTSRDKFESNTP